jgi:hypothetical protein
MLGDKVHSKNNENTRFSAESRQTTFHTHEKNKKYNTAGTVPKSNRKIDKNRGKIDTLKGIMSLINTIII